jgi:UDP-N-acetylmuramate--alanine ligase
MPLFNPADKRTVHFMGIGGAGMSALALIARRRGVSVSGCDVDISGVADLEALGVTVVQGHDGAHLQGARAVVVTAAISGNHPELQRAKELGLLVVPRKVALAELIKGAQAVGISGTHGKTTTTVMTTILPSSRRHSRRRGRRFRADGLLLSFSRISIRALRFTPRRWAKRLRRLIW